MQYQEYTSNISYATDPETEESESYCCEVEKKDFNWKKWRLQLGGMFKSQDKTAVKLRRREQEPQKQV